MSKQSKRREEAMRIKVMNGVYVAPTTSYLHESHYWICQMCGKKTSQNFRGEVYCPEHPFTTIVWGFAKAKWTARSK